MPSQLAGLIERHGGRALSAPALREVPLPTRPEVVDAIEALAQGNVDIVVFQTGVGARALLAAAESLGRKDDVLQGLRDVRVVCRGPKPLAVMREHRVPVALAPPEPYTSETLVASLSSAGWDFQGKRVLLQHYGEVNAYLRDELSRRGAALKEISLYEWALPEDTSPLEEAIEAMVEGRVDAVAFTTQAQVRHLFQVADRLGRKEALKDAMRERVVVAPVGPVCVRALAQEGVTSHVTPDHPKMGPLVLALAGYFTQTSATPGG